MNLKIIQYFTFWCSFVKVSSTLGRAANLITCFHLYSAEPISIGMKMTVPILIDCVVSSKKKLKKKQSCFGQMLIINVQCLCMAKIPKNFCYVDPMQLKFCTDIIYGIRILHKNF